MERLIYGGKFAFQNRLGFIFEGNFQVQAPRGADIWRGDSTEGLLRFRSGGAYIWRGLFSEFYGIHRFSSKLIRMKEKYANSKMDLRNFFCLRCNLSNDDKLSV